MWHAKPPKYVWLHAKMPKRYGTLIQSAALTIQLKPGIPDLHNEEVTRKC